MTARLWWVRHGPTHVRTMVGWTDLPADLEDAAALARLDAVLPREAAVISSDLVRAVATADALRGDRPRLPHDPDLREIHFGTWENRSHEDISAKDEPLSRRFWENPGDVAPPRGESWHALQARVDAAADRLIRRGGDVIVVAHFGPILTQLQRALGCSATEAFGHTIRPLSLTQCNWDGGRWSAGRIDHIA